MYQPKPSSNKKPNRSIEKAIDECHQCLEAGVSPFALISCLQIDGLDFKRAKQIVLWAKNRMPKEREKMQGDPVQW